MLRLVKTWLPADLIREMDEILLASAGAYSGRDDFIGEAISDRNAEERQRLSAPLQIDRSCRRNGLERALATRNATPELTDLGLEPANDFDDRIPTLPPQRVQGGLYGLHNRDYPTLWATHSLLRMAAQCGEPFSWDQFVSAILEIAWRIGTHLAKLDTERGPQQLKAAVGFPANAEKKQSSETRFIEHMLGIPDRENGPTGPLFAFQLAGLKQGPDSHFFVAPTDQARTLWDGPVRVGFASSVTPPHPEAAWSVFREHLRACLPEDYQAWMRVLRVLGEHPTRGDLVKEFVQEWPGAAALTNVAGYVSRGREWGLVESKLADGRYAITELGKCEVAGVVK